MRGRQERQTERVQPEPRPRVRTVTAVTDNGGAGRRTVPPQLVLRAYDVLENCRTVRVYGSTEAPIITLGWRQDRQLAATTDGHPFGYEVRIVDDEGREFVEEIGTCGLLWVGRERGRVMGLVVEIC